MVFFEKHGVVEEEYFQTFLLINYNFPLHFHRAYELIYIKDGQLELTIDQKDYQLRKNDMAFVFHNQMHEFKTLEQSVITVILFSPEMVGDFYTNYKHFIPDSNILSLKQEPDLSKLDTLYGRKSFLYSICDELIKNTTFSEIKRSPQTKVLYKILLYVEQNYMKECTLKEVAKHLQYDYSYISKLFAQRMNLTFTEYLNQYRISQACYMLKNKNQSISEVAGYCGYNNLRTFHRNFRQITGKSPSLYLS